MIEEPDLLPPLKADIREEKLGRALCDVYGGVVKESSLNHHIIVKFFTKTKKSTLPLAVLSFSNWHMLLLGKHYNLNAYVKVTPWLSHIHLIQYESLDELELQLTLMGRNPM